MDEVIETQNTHPHLTKEISDLLVKWEYGVRDKFSDRYISSSHFDCDSGYCMVFKNKSDRRMAIVLYIYKLHRDHCIKMGLTLYHNEKDSATEFLNAKEKSIQDFVNSD